MFTTWGLEHHPLMPAHCRLSAAATPGELVINPEGFFTGRPAAGPDRTSAPNWHWSQCTFCMLGLEHSFSIHGSDQDVACKGCSCRKYLLPSSCYRYRLQTNSMCFLARASASSKAVVSVVRARFKAIHVLKALHAGDPIRR